MATPLEPVRSALDRFEISPGGRNRLLYLYLGFIYLLVLAPVIYTIPAAFDANLNALTQELYVDAIINSFQLAFVVGFIATPLATVSARFYRHVQHKNAYLLFMTLPLFVPGDTHALGMAVLANTINVPLSFWTLTLAHVFYVFPFAFLMILATMSGLPQNLIAAAEDLGADGLRAFFDVELPLVLDGVISGFLVAFLLSINEAPRASVVGGEFETISAVIVSVYGAVGLDATVYAINVFLVAFALVVITVILALVVFRS